ncbi:hypothetical protein PRNP1_010044 [Phytophthora ramorum]
MNVLVLIASGTIVLSSVPLVLGHGYIVDPAATWKDGYAVNGWGSSIDSNMWGSIDSSVYGYGTTATVAFFEAQFNSSGYNSLGQFIETNQWVGTFVCGGDGVLQCRHSTPHNKQRVHRDGDDCVPRYVFFLHQQHYLHNYDRTIDDHGHFNCLFGGFVRFDHHIVVFNG